MQHTIPRVALVNMSNIGECPHIAQALEEAGMLARWYTGLHYSPGGAFDIGRVLPGIKRRHYDQIALAHVHTMSGWEWLRLATLRISVMSGEKKRRMERWCSNRFTMAVARHLAANPVDIVLGVNFTSLEVFETAQRQGMLTGLSQRIQHPAVLQAIMTNELQLRGIERNRFFEPSQLRRVQRGVQEIDLADVVLCPSQSVVDSMLDQGVPETKLRLVPFGVNLTRFQNIDRSDDAHDRFRILYVGSIGHRKGVPYLIEAFQQINLPNAELVLVGALDGISKEELAVASTVSHIEWTPPDQLVDYYLSADVFVLPSLSEGSALVGYEAMAAGLPVVASTSAGTLVREGVDGFLVPPRDVDVLKYRILRLYHDRPLRQQMGESARLYINAFSWDHYRRNIAASMQQIWDQHSPY